MPQVQQPFLRSGMQHMARKLLHRPPADMPVVHRAGTPAMRKADATSTDTWPPSVIFITSRVASSV